MLIGFGIRKNLFYLWMLILFTFLRKVLLIIFHKVFNFEDYYLSTLIYYFSKFLFGVIIYLRQMNFVKKRHDESYFMGIRLLSEVHETPTFSNSESLIKIIILFFLTSYFDLY